MNRMGPGLRRLWGVIFCLNLLLISCSFRFIEEEMPKSKAQPESKPHPRRMERVRKRELTGPDPIVRIGVMEEYDRIDFSLEGAFDLFDLEGNLIREELEADRRWHVSPDRTNEARAVYSVLTTAFAQRDSADHLRRILSQKNHPARVVEVGEEIYIAGKLISNNIKYRVLVGRFPTEREARKHLDAFREDFAPRVVRQVIRPTTGTVELYNDGFSFDQLIENGFRLVPKNDSSQVTLYAVREGTGFHWEREVDRTYPGVIEVRLDHRALLMALNELPLETYLKGVVPAEMPASYPFDALKAQAIAARSEVLSKIGVKHLNDPFDLCGMVHCQAYTGCSHMHKRASEAVEATRGQVLMMNGRVAEAVFHACCGGHTEDKVNVWNPPDAPHLKGGYDAPSDFKLSENLDLTQEGDVEKWVDSEPPMWCNVAAHQGLPEILARSEKYFRWHVSYSHRELEEIIRRKSGEDIGTLLDIIPLKRGVSGRLMEIEIQGTHRNLLVQRELNIRRILSPSYLYSACFTIEIDTTENGQPVNFHFHGAGWGHGVGMCQVGAGVMAAEGKGYKQILRHYYPGTTVEKVYGDKKQ